MAENLRRGVAFMLLSIACLVVLDTTAKVLTGRMDPMQAVWGRYAFSVLALPLLMSPRRLRRALKTRALLLQLFRSAVLVATTASFFVALKYIPLADAIAISFAAPLLTTALAIPVLRERVGPRRWTAIVIGLVGVLVVLRPGFEVRHWAYLLPLLAAVLLAFYSVATRLALRRDSTDTSLAYTNLVGALVATAAMAAWPERWHEPDAIDWSLMAITGSFAALGHLFMILAYRHAQVSRLAPYTFTHIVLAVLAGWLVFRDWPDAATLVGSGIIAATSIYVFRREALLARSGGDG